MRLALVTIVGLAITAAMLVSAPALADGDPASDILIGENVFYPFSPPVAGGLQKTLNSETAAAHAAHFPIKVALIASPADLGAIPSLFAKPQQYAHFLEQEISFLNIKQLLLVVMPNGYGVQGLNQVEAKAVASLRPPTGSRSDDLARAAILAVPTLAAAAGHPIGDVPSGGGGDGGSGATVVGVGVLVCVAVVASAALLGFRHRRARHG
jgi:hypothetical protein